MKKLTTIPPSPNDPTQRPAHAEGTLQLVKPCVVWPVGSTPQMVPCSHSQDAYRRPGDCLVRRQRAKHLGNPIVCRPPASSTSDTILGTGSHPATPHS